MLPFIYIKLHKLALYKSWEKAIIDNKLIINILCSFCWINPKFANKKKKLELHKKENIWKACHWFKSTWVLQVGKNRYDI